MNFKKEDKWLLASNLQKSIRRGMVEEAQWSVRQLYDVDRAYLAYRLSVIAVEDVGGGNENITKWIDENRKWGAKRFNDKKSDEDKKIWEGVAKDFALSIKDRTPCKWMGCTRFLQEFEKTEGKWEDLDERDCIEKAYDQSKPWWWRGLMAWRVAGTKRFPNSFLPEVEGMWDEWVKRCDDESVKILLTGYGERQREAHPVFLPLAIYDRKNDLKSKVVEVKLKESEKIGPWIDAALDSHTAEGKKAISLFLKKHPLKNDILKNGWQDGMEIISRVIFWAEGGVVDKYQDYLTAQKIDKDLKIRWFKEKNLSGKWVAENILNKIKWNEARQTVINDWMNSHTDNENKKERKFTG